MNKKLVVACLIAISSGSASAEAPDVPEVYTGAVPPVGECTPFTQGGIGRRSFHLDNSGQPSVNQLAANITTDQNFLICIKESHDKTKVELHYKTLAQNTFKERSANKGSCALFTASSVRIRAILGEGVYEDNVFYDVSICNLDK